MTRLHLTVALLLGFVLPAYSWLDGSGWFAWTMFARSATYRLTVRVRDQEGFLRAINPTSLARFARGDAANYLAGSEHFRHAPAGPSLSRNLASLAGLGCLAVPGARSSSVKLESRATLDAPLVENRTEVACPATSERGAKP
jgi:hypothetical protein